jgi:ketosteroid isomerase-like protein
VLVWPDEGIIVESAGRNLETGLPSSGWIWYLRAAAGAEAGVIRGRRVADRTFICPDQVRALKKAEVLSTHCEPGEVGGTADLSAASAMAQLKRPYRALDFEPDRTTETASPNHYSPPKIEFMSIGTEMLEQFYAALNRNDLLAITKDLDPEIVRIEFEGLPMAGTYRGIAEVKEHITKGRGTWAEGACEPEEFLENGNRVVVYVHVLVRLEGSTDWVEGRIADGFEFREGKIIEFRSFVERSDALKWAGIKK